MRVLLAEDDQELSKALGKFLVKAKYDVDIANDGQEAIDYFDSMQYDVVISDIMMPRVDGIGVVKHIRAKGSNVPVLLLTARTELEDKITGLDAGADDYLTKPFDVMELIARIRALTRRSAVFVEPYKIGNITLDTSTFEVVCGDQREHLTAKEYKILELLIRNKNSLISTEKIMDAVWEYDSEAQINVVWVFIASLRKKLEKIGSDQAIKAVRGLGYKLEAK